MLLTDDDIMKVWDEVEQRGAAYGGDDLTNAQAVAEAQLLKFINHIETQIADGVWLSDILKEAHEEMNRVIN